MNELNRLSVSPDGSPAWRSCTVHTVLCCAATLPTLNLLYLTLVLTIGAPFAVLPVTHLLSRMDPTNTIGLTITPGGGEER